MSETPFNRLINPDKADRPGLWDALGIGVASVMVSSGAVLIALVGLLVVRGLCLGSQGQSGRSSGW